ncbi:zinc-dependent alcohol dehydrogenase [Priestia endophytica]|uniref:zinc-dependent alcohol dehydrogenase n=1 Tax=Priestia endophytica TaxID=135735 RepID=UPI000F5247F5|nr:alcohol dehydrogenase catalytic domain-containing protein [Priestia endophytica]RPK03085.1 alcohol dehydrogenase [Priestia endophytica]
MEKLTQVVNNSKIENVMKAARMHALGKPLVVEGDVPVPDLGEEDLLIEVKAVHVAQYHKSALIDGEHSYPFYTTSLPAILGMAGAGIISKVGNNILGFQEGERVYVNPILTCGNCDYCIEGKPGLCDMWVLQGYFALFTPNGVPLLERYPGGFAQYMKVPARSVVRIPDNVSFEHAVRFNYIGTAYEGLKSGDLSPGDTVLINGATGTMGTDATLLSLAMGATKVIVVGRSSERLARLKQVNPQRIHTINVIKESIHERIKEVTGGKGVHVYLDALGYSAGQTPPINSVMECIGNLRKNGTAVFIGALSGQKISYDYGSFVGLNIKITGSCWYNNESVLELMEMAAGGTLKFDDYETHLFSLDEVNEALDFASQRSGGLNNIVVRP